MGIGRTPRSGLVAISLSARVHGHFLRCSISILMTHTLPSIQSNLGPIRHHVLCAVRRSNLAPSGTFHGSTAAMNSILNRCRPRNSTSICSTVIHVTRSFSLHCPLISNRNGFNTVSNSPTTTCHCARTHVDGVDLSVLTSVSGRAISFIPGFSSAAGRPSILPSHFPGLLIGNSANVTINVTAGVPPRGLYRIISTVYLLVSGPRTRLTSVVRFVGNPSFPANNIIVNHDNVHTTCTANHNHVAIHTGARVRRRNGHAHVIVDRVPCRIGLAGLIGSVVRLISSGHVRNVTSIISRSDVRNLQIIVSLGQSTIPRIILGRLFTCARLRIAFNTVVLTLISNAPQILALGRVLRRCVGFRVRIVAHHAIFRLHGTGRHTRVFRTLGATISFVSRIVGVVHGSGSRTSTGLTLVRQFTFSSIRTSTVIGVHLNRLSNLRQRGVRSRLNRLRAHVTSCRSVLTGRNHIGTVIGSRYVGVQSGCNSRHHARVSVISNRISVRSLVPRRRYILALASGNCVGHRTMSDCSTRHHNNHNVGNVAAHSRSIAGDVFVYSDRSCIVFFADLNHICHLGYFRIPRNDHATGNVGVIGLLPLRPRRGVDTVVHLRSCARNLCLDVVAHQNVVGHAQLSTCAGIHGDNLVTVSLSRNSRLIQIRAASNGTRLLITAHQNVTVHFSRASTHLINHATHNIGTLGLTTSSTIINVRIISSRGQLLAIDRSNLNHLDHFDSCHIRSHNNGNLAGCRARGCNRIMNVRAIGPRSSLVLVSSSNVVVHVRVDSVHLYDHVSGNIQIVHVNRGIGVISVTATRRSRSRIGTAIRSSNSTGRSTRSMSRIRVTRRAPTRRWGAPKTSHIVGNQPHLFAFYVVPMGALIHV